MRIGLAIAAAALIGIGTWILVTFVKNKKI